MQFPCHLYKFPGPHDHCGIKYKYVGCKDAAEFEELTAKGWSASLEAPEPIDEKTPPSRAELEQKATELGIKFDGRTNDRKLAGRIAEVLG